LNGGVLTTVDSQPPGGGAVHSQAAALVRSRRRNSVCRDDAAAFAAKPLAFRFTHFAERKDVMKDNSGSVKSVEKAFMLLECFMGEEKRLSLNTLSKMTGWPKSTIYNILSAMRRQGVIVQHEEDGKYAMGLRMFQLGNAVAQTSAVIHIAKTIMEEAANRINRSIHLTAFNYPQVVLISRAEPKNNPLKMLVPVGIALQPHCTAPGKLFLSQMPDRLLREYLKETKFPQFTSKTITDSERLLKHIQKIREQGYSVEINERNLGISGVAAPITDLNGKMVYALGTVGIFNDLVMSEFQSATDMVIDAANAITKRIAS
jgi:DNA-binding IclR family transcriptional regulator